MENIVDENANDLPTEPDSQNAATLEYDPVLTWKDKLKYYIATHWRGIVCAITPILLIPILSFPPEKYQWCAYTLVLMAVYWVSECIPLAVTSFLPVIIFPLTGVMHTRETCECYMNDTIMMFLGSLILACAVEQSGLHMRLALCAIRLVGYSHYRLLFAMCFVTMFVSMWITNTAAATMMVPINFAVLKVFEDQNLLSIYEIGSNGENVASDITSCYFCAAAFSATIGGIGSLVGTATNLVFKGLFIRTYPDAPEYLSFPMFSAFSVPMMLLMQLSTYLYLLIVYLGFLRPNSKAAKQAYISPTGIEAARITVNEKFLKLGRITLWEIIISAVPFLLNSMSYSVRDSAAAMLIAFLMLLIPSTLKFFDNFKAKYHGDLPDSGVKSVLDWTVMNNSIPYSFMFLLGGGFALSKAANKDYSDLNGRIGEFLRSWKNLPNSIIILLILILTTFITNFASNVAVCNVIAPIVMQLAKEINRNPLWYNIAAGLASSYAYCLPVGTPGNLVVQGAVNMPTAKMIKAGIGPSILTILINWFFILFWAPVIWPDLKTLPGWLEDDNKMH